MFWLYVIYFHSWSQTIWLFLFEISYILYGVYCRNRSDWPSLKQRREKWLHGLHGKSWRNRCSSTEQRSPLSSPSYFSGLNTQHSCWRNPKRTKFRMKRSSRPWTSRWSSESQRSSPGQRQRSRPPAQRSKSLKLTFIALTFTTVGYLLPAPLLWPGLRGTRSETTSRYCTSFIMSLWHYITNRFSCVSPFLCLSVFRKAQHKLRQRKRRKRPRSSLPPAPQRLIDWQIIIVDHFH